MSYAERFMKAKEEGKTRDISATIFKFETPGDQLVGELVGFGKVEMENERGEKSEVLKYTILTDDGQVSCILGYAGDAAIREANVVNGDGIFIEYRGKKQLTGQKQINIFKIEKFPL